MSSSHCAEEGSPQSAAGGLAAKFRGLAASFDEVKEQIADADADTIMEAVTLVAVARMPGADYASITLLDGDRFRTAAASDERARLLDRLQYDLGRGPCVEAVTEGSVHTISDTRHDTRWPIFAEAAAKQFGVGSVVAYRLRFDADETVGSLNLYGSRAGAFDDHDLAFGLLVAAHATLAVVAAASRKRAAALERALETSREIGIAIGILMRDHKVTRDQAIGLLRLASQHTHRKLRDVASDVVYTGTLVDLPAPSRKRGPESSASSHDHDG